MPPPLRLGLDIGGTRVKAAVVAADGSARTGKSEKYKRPDRTRLLRAIGEALPDHDPTLVACTGICCPGLVEDGRVVASVNVPGLCGSTLGSLVADATGSASPVTRATDAFATTVDAAARLGLVGRVMLLAVGTGVGACVIDRADKADLGTPLRVDGDSPGHFGQLDVRLGDDPPLGPDGGAGGLEAYLSTRAIRGTRPEFLGDDHDAIRALVRALRIGHALYRPHHLVLAGGVGVRLSHLHDEIKREVGRDLTGIARAGWTLSFGVDDYHAARGAARLAATA